MVHELSGLAGLAVSSSAPSFWAYVEDVEKVVSNLGKTPILLIGCGSAAFSLSPSW